MAGGTPAIHDPSSLPGTHRNRVFVGGSFQPVSREVLGVVEQAIRDTGFEPVLADRFALLRPDHDIHDVTLALLHGCRLAVFDLTGLSGALMELERCRDYGLFRVLLLYHHPFGRMWPDDPDAWATSAMVKSLVREDAGRFQVRPFVRPAGAATETRRFLRAVRSSSYGKLHSL
ncbi:MAG: hypothetical protein WBD40_19405 [Tepidisphaeraceae bacterium]